MLCCCFIFRAWCSFEYKSMMRTDSKYWFHWFKFHFRLAKCAALTFCSALCSFSFFSLHSLVISAAVVTILNWVIPDAWHFFIPFNWLIVARNKFILNSKLRENGKKWKVVIAPYHSLKIHWYSTKFTQSFFFEQIFLSSNKRRGVMRVCLCYSKLLFLNG